MFVASRLARGVAATGEDMSDEGIQDAGSTQERPAAVAILNARGMQFEDERASSVTFSSIDLLAGVVATRAAGFRCERGNVIIHYVDLLGVLRKYFHINCLSWLGLSDRRSATIMAAITSYAKALYHHNAHFPTCI
jgi:hypothetical protein